MKTALKYRQDNIVMYLLYMWQLEDLMRATGLDDEKFLNITLPRYTDDAERGKAREWYENLLEMMRHEHLATGGHLQINKNVLIRLNDLHVQLLAEPDRFADYHKAYYDALPLIVELRAKGGDSPAGELETCFNLTYGVVMLHMGGKPVSEATMQALKVIGSFTDLLAHYYHMDEQSPLFEPQDE